MKLAAPIHIRVTRRLHVIVVWCVLLAIPIQGASGVIVQWLGIQHFHTPRAVMLIDAMQDWLYFSRIEAIGGPLRVSERMHEHSHAGIARHHHRINDPSVVPLGATAFDDGPMADVGDASSASAGSIIQAFALQPNVSQVVPAPASLGWPEHAQPLIKSWDPRRIKRPPRALV